MKTFVNWHVCYYHEFHIFCQIYSMLHKIFIFALLDAQIYLSGKSLDAVESFCTKLLVSYNFCELVSLINPLINCGFLEKNPHVQNRVLCRGLTQSKLPSFLNLWKKEISIFTFYACCKVDNT